MSALSQWLQLMLAEITRKQEESCQRARAKADRRAREQAQVQQQPTTQARSAQR